MPRTSPGKLVLPVLLFWAAGSVQAVSTRGSDTALPPAHLPGGLADPAGQTGYLANPDGGIDAVELATGRLLWSTAAASKPLFLEGRHLVAQAAVKGKANALALVTLDVLDRGKVVKEAGPIIFPPWVSVTPARGRSFTRTVQLENGSLVLHWQAAAWYVGAARPSPAQERAALKHDSGTVRIDLESGRVSQVITASSRSRRRRRPPLPPSVDPALPRELRAVTSLPYWTGAAWETRPFLTNNRVVVFARDRKQGQAVVKVRLKTWDRRTARPQLDVVLFQGKSLWLQVPPDRRHVFIHQALPRDQLPEGDDAWWVFALDTGQQVAKVPYEIATGEINLLGPRVYYLVHVSRPAPKGATRTLTLKAVDVKSGKPLWQRPVWAPPASAPLP